MNMTDVIDKKIPNQIGSQPISRTTGRKIGNVMNMMVIASMNIPAMSNTSPITIKIMNGECEKLSNACE